jgi:hypothetical protein
MLFTICLLSKLLPCSTKIHSFLTRLGPIPVSCVSFIYRVLGDTWNSYVYRYLEWSDQSGVFHIIISHKKGDENKCLFSTSKLHFSQYLDFPLEYNASVSKGVSGTARKLMYWRLHIEYSSSLHTCETLSNKLLLKV